MLLKIHLRCEKSEGTEIINMKDIRRKQVQFFWGATSLSNNFVTCLEQIRTNLGRTNCDFVLKCVPNTLLLSQANIHTMDKHGVSTAPLHNVCFCLCQCPHMSLCDATVVSGRPQPGLVTYAPEGTCLFQQTATTVQAGFATFQLRVSYTAHSPQRSQSHSARSSHSRLCPQQAPRVHATFMSLTAGTAH